MTTAVPSSVDPEVIGQVYVGALTLDLLLGDVRSLKQKRSVLRPVIAEVRKRFPAVAVAETGGTELYRRAEIGVAVVSGTAANCTQVLDQCERLVAGRPEIELLSARRRLFSDED
ncbi:hypothetical protein FHX41_4122 [Actinomadura hallensis]|uniref:DUF503 domain-containing protein n=1 Tax=Actinomadura hallensis TaxID=337895 RepID=A0A543IIJ2_9ACTN|nr:DUF503 domain-containing protein [Actinomadura hallensis]TQM70398.1 hypothetical protein FHX41_4122 [Actinomadura hallensis]